MGETMKAAVFKKAGLLEVEQIPRPRASHGQVVMKVSYCGICGSDLHRYAYGHMAEGVIMGHEFSGVITEVGPGVDGWKVGDRASRGYRGPLPPRFSARDKGFSVDPRSPGAYAEYILQPAAGLMHLPDSLEDDVATLAEPLSIGVHAVRLSALKMGDAVVVLGAGPIGLLTLQCVKQSGPSLVIVSEPAPARRELAARLGADVTIDPRETDVVEEVVRLTGGLGADVVFECAGAKPTLQQGLEMVRQRGQVVLVALCMEPTTVTPLDWVGREVQLQCSYSADARDWDLSLALLADGRVQGRPLISSVVSLDEIQTAFQALLQPSDQLQVLVRP